MTTTSNQALHAVRVVKHVRIPMADGVELDAHLYMPDRRLTKNSRRFSTIIPIAKMTFRPAATRAAQLYGATWLCGHPHRCTRNGQLRRHCALTNIACKNNWMRSRPLPGWPNSPGVTAMWACLAPPMVASTRCKSPCTGPRPQSHLPDVFHRQPLYRRLPLQRRRDADAL